MGLIEENEKTEWEEYFFSKLRFKTIDMANPDTTDYRWSISGCVHPGYNERDLVLFLSDEGKEDFTLPLDRGGAKDLLDVLTAYLKWEATQP